MTYFCSLNYLRQIPGNIMIHKTISFSRIDKAKFFRVLNKRVNTYFKDGSIITKKLMKK